MEYSQEISGNKYFKNKAGTLKVQKRLPIEFAQVIDHKHKKICNYILPHLFFIFSLVFT